MSTPQSPRKSVSFKVSVLGDAQVGKTKLLTKYMQSKQFDTTYIETIGVNTMEKTIQLPSLTVHIHFWELGGQQESISLLPAVCSDSKVIFFVFDLTQKSSLISIKNWYKKSKREKKNFIPFLIGTKFDLFEGSACSYRTDITLIARTYAQRMKAPLIYCSSAQSMNIRKLFKLLTRNLLNLKPKMKQKQMMHCSSLIHPIVYAHTENIKQYIWGKVTAIGCTKNKQRRVLRYSITIQKYSKNVSNESNHNWICLNMIHPNSSKLNKYLAYPYDCVMCLFFNSPLFFSLIFYSLYDKCCIDLFI
eukprot:605896_1